LYFRKQQKRNIEKVDKEQIKKLFQEIFPTINLKLIYDHPFDPENRTRKDFEVLVSHLFFLCIISNRLEIGKFFWKIGKVLKIII
jgi:cell division FtsZ-interacting protein ZapD